MFNLILWISICIEAGAALIFLVNSIRRSLQSKEYRNEWVNFWIDEDWGVNKVVLYELFFLDLFTCRECGKINRHGKLCSECREEYIKDEI